MCFCVCGFLLLMCDSGLSYTTFNVTWSNGEPAPATFSDASSSVTYTVNITNTGPVAGDEVRVWQRTACPRTPAVAPVFQGVYICAALGLRCLFDVSQVAQAYYVPSRGSIVGLAPSDPVPIKQCV
jgi:hypothetical protein